MAIMSLLRKAHKWLALLVGLQLLIWLVTGLLFTLVDSSQSRGKIYRAKEQTQQVPVIPKQILTNQQLLTVLPESFDANNIKSILLTAFGQHWYYQLEVNTGTNSIRYLFSVITGKQLIVKEELALELINNSYQGPGKLIELDLLTPPIAGFNNSSGNIWQAHFNDDLNTYVYLAQNTGRIIKHTNDVTSYNDLLKLLHFMDYNQSGHFNSWWIITMAFFTILLSLTGLFWLINSYSKKFKKRFLKAA